MKRLFLVFLLIAGPVFAGPAKVDFEVARGEDRSYSITFTDQYGDPVDISTDSFYYAAVATWSADSLSISTASIVKSNSGQGTTDTITIKITDTLSDIAVGYYNHAVGRVFADGDKEVVITGTLRVTGNASPLGW